MMRTALLLTAAAITALAFAAAAAAKEVTALRACGDSGCTTITDPDRLSGLPLGGDTQRPPPSAAPYYVLHFSMDGGDNQFAFLYVPSARAVGANGEQPGSLVWFPTDDSFAAIADDLEPFTAPPDWPSEVKSPGRLPTSATTTTSDADGRGPLGWLVIVLAVAGPPALAVGLGLSAHRRRATAAPQT
jgi:hypothetical protein